MKFKSKENIPFCSAASNRLRMSLLVNYFCSFVFHDSFLSRNLFRALTDFFMKFNISDRDSLRKKIKAFLLLNSLKINCLSMQISRFGAHSGEILISHLIYYREFSYVFKHQFKSFQGAFTLWEREIQLSSFLLLNSEFKLKLSSR